MYVYIYIYRERDMRLIYFNPRRESRIDEAHAYLLLCLRTCPQLIFIHIHKLFTIQYTLVSLDTVSIY